MPSLNLKTKKLRYSQADLNAIDAFGELLDLIIDYDEEAAECAKTCRASAASLALHVSKARKPKPEKTPA